MTMAWHGRCLRNIYTYSYTLDRMLACLSHRTPAPARNRTKSAPSLIKGPAAFARLTRSFFIAKSAADPEADGRLLPALERKRARGLEVGGSDWRGGSSSDEEVSARDSGVLHAASRRRDLEVVVGLPPVTHAAIVDGAQPPGQVHVRGRGAKSSSTGDRAEACTAPAAQPPDPRG